MKNIFFGFLGIIGLFTLFGCGFEPLYKTQSDVNIVRETAQITVLPVVGEGGYQAELILRERLNPNGVSDQQKYLLSVEILKPKFSDQSILESNFVSLEKMELSVKYKLTERETNRVLISSSVSGSGSYDIVNEPYATVMARNKTHQNLVRNLSNDIALHMMAYLKGKTR